VDPVEWNLTDGSLLAGTCYGEVLVIDSRGAEAATVPLPCLSRATTEPHIVSLEWHKRADFGLLIAFARGQLQLMRNQSDSAPIVATVTTEITCAAWFKGGAAIAVGGVKGSARSVVRFLSPMGRRASLRSLSSESRSWRSARAIC
jgi:WD repeat-containing protein 35